MPSINIHNFSLEKLMEFASTAKGDIFLKTSEGDMLNMKSKLTQLLALSGNIDWGTVGEATVICKNPEDESRLFRLNLWGEDSQS